MVELDVERLWQKAKPDRHGLLPCVVQDVRSRSVLMVAWVSREALAQTLTSGWATFWSRSRGELWQKGGTSGNRQEMREVRLDCDGDVLLYVVDPRGPACHEGHDTCFSRRQVGNGWSFDPQVVLGKDVPHQGAGGGLERFIDDASRESTTGRSKMKRLIAGGIPVQAAQLRETLEELVHALGAESADNVADKASELLLDLAVALRGRKLALDQVLGVLDERVAASASRAERPVSGASGAQVPATTPDPGVKRRS